MKRKALAVLIFLYFAIAAYGRFHKPPPEPVCSCNECDCGTQDDLRNYEKGTTP